jgi:Protein of unknown function (DUF2637)
MADMTPNVLRSAWIRWPRSIALRLLTLVILAASLASFAQSYRGLYLWATHHGVTGFWAATWPLMVDTFIVAGEVALFIALVDNWERRWRVVAWAVAAAGVAISVTGNAGHAPASDFLTRATFAVPPLAAAGTLFVGLLILKAAIAAMTAASPSETVATMAAREVAIARSGERGYAAMLAASARAREADRKRQEKADRERARETPRRPRPAADGRNRTRPTGTGKQAAIQALIAQPDMSPEDLADLGGKGRTARRWRTEARELATAGANGHGHPDGETGS